MIIRQEIKKIIEKVVEGGVVDFSVEAPADKIHGDYSSNVALLLAKKTNKNPKEVAEEIKTKIKSDLFSKIEAAGPGFINFFVRDEVFVEELKKIDKNFGKEAERPEHGRRIILDYTDANLFKEFHIGHLMSNAIGESLSRIFEFQGAKKVVRVCYQSDIGLNIAKAVWGLNSFPDHPMFPKDSDPLEKKMKFLSMAYAYGALMYEDDEAAKKGIIELNKKIFEKSDKEITKLYEKGKKWSLEHFDEIYKKLGTKFDDLIFESQVVAFGKKIVEKNLGKVFEKGEKGAIIFKGEKYGLHTRVFITSEGLPTYEAKDLGLAELKYKKYKHDYSIIVTASEQNEYFKVMLCAMDKINPSLAGKTKHIGHGMLRLPEGKMSSRTGNVITGELLIEKVEGLIKEKIRDRDLSEKEKVEIAERVAVGALKYSILKQSIGSDIIFDFDKSISFEGDSGPYLQYSYARTRSVLRKAKEEGVKPSFQKIPAEITQLEKIMHYFPDVVSKANQSYQPNAIVLYLTELASEFNGYYAKNRLVDKSDKFSPYRIAVTNAFSIIMKNGLWLLGIDALEKM